MADSTEIQINLKKIATWKRLGFMALFAVILGLVRVLIWAIILLQIVWVLLLGSPNRNVLKLGQNLSLYIYRIFMFLTFNTDEMPFPFADWNELEDTIS